MSAQWVHRLWPPAVAARFRACCLCHPDVHRSGADRRPRVRGVAMVRIPVVLAAVTALGLATSPDAGADTADWGLNGTYIATSNGELARKNEVFFEQRSLRSTWTISTQCSYPGECTGTVVSEWGWTRSEEHTSELQSREN